MTKREVYFHLIVGDVLVDSDGYEAYYDDARGEPFRLRGGHLVDEPLGAVLETDGWHLRRDKRVEDGGRLTAY